MWVLLQWRGGRSNGKREKSICLQQLLEISTCSDNPSSNKFGLWKVHCSYANLIEDILCPSLLCWRGFTTFPEDMDRSTIYHSCQMFWIIPTYMVQRTFVLDIYCHDKDDPAMMSSTWHFANVISTEIHWTIIICITLVCWALRNVL